MKNGKSPLPVGTTPGNEKVPPSGVPAMLPEIKSSSIHNRSHAAHLDFVASEPNMRPAGNLTRGSYRPERKQP